MGAQQWVTLAVGLSAIVGAMATLWQRRRSEARVEWWRRFEWASDRAFGDGGPALRKAGMCALEVLMESPLATPSEVDMVRVIAADLTLVDNGEEEEGHDDRR